MKHTLLAALLLGAHLMAPAQSTRSMAPPIVVEVVDGALRLSAEGYTLSGSQTVVTWQIGTEGWRFASSSIRFSDSSAPFSCSTFAEGQAIRCVSSGASRGRYDYSIALRGEDGRLTAMPQPNVYISLD
ncbi:hypothetical protein [Rubrivivax rivuli]|uniref:Uncharacterized protein n=1 Tax=Rubrivivax rivuli TaxID=1862385 RepID=A0A437RCF8_9BURK|nr:hypothetical protein [Rubrivivax rivuli]RVU44373.1 hypothetical protein EOE66_16995 [Rubrivivax rivuli]